MKYVIETPVPSVVVITPSIGSPKLEKAIESIQNQTHVDVQHLIVADGPEYAAAVEGLLRRVDTTKRETIKAVCPFNTGADGFYGHRIYAGYVNFVNAKYTFFLDEDNWYEPDHVASLVSVLENDISLDFAYSLRKIFDVSGDYLCEDNCEALGEYPIFLNENEYLIDTSAFAFKTSYIKQRGSWWHQGWGGDRIFLSIAKQQKARFKGSYKHTLCYRLAGNTGSVTKDFFEQGNAAMEKRYGDKLPWKI